MSPRSAVSVRRRAYLCGVEHEAVFWIVVVVAIALAFAIGLGVALLPGREGDEELGKAGQL